MTLANAVFGQNSLLKQTLLALGGAIFVAFAAQLNIGWPVPITLQTLAILIVGLSFGAKLGASSLAVYLGYGAMGLPVFANAANGAAFFGPTAGFLLGFVMLAWLAGAAAERWLPDALSGKLTALVALFAALLGAGALLYVPGLAWPIAVAGATGIEGSWVGNDFASYYWPYFVKPFILGDVIKTVLALMIVGGGLAALRKRG